MICKFISVLHGLLRLGDSMYVLEAPLSPTTNLPTLGMISISRSKMVRQALCWRASRIHSGDPPLHPCLAITLKFHSIALKFHLHRTPNALSVPSWTPLPTPLSWHSPGASFKAWNTPLALKSISCLSIYQRLQDH